MEKFLIMLTATAVCVVANMIMLTWDDLYLYVPAFIILAGAGIMSFGYVILYAIHRIKHGEWPK